MKRVFLKYNVPSIEMLTVAVDHGYKDSIFVELPEIDGSKEEGEW